jgi:Anti-sigma-K factor rskA
LIAMTRPTNNPNPTDLVAGYILDDLSPEETARLNQALAETPDLYQDIASFGEAFALLPYNMPLVAPPAGLKAKILSAASQTIGQPVANTRQPTRPNQVVPMVSDRSRSGDPAEPAVIGRPRRRNWQQWMPAISAGIAAAAIAAVGLNQVQLNRQSQQTIALQQQLEATNRSLETVQRELKVSQGMVATFTQPGAQTYALTGATSKLKNGQLATAQLVAKPGARTVTLVAHSLPKLSNQQIYRLWAVAAPAAAPTYCGQFRQDDSGKAQWDAPSAACTQKPLQLMITLDGPTDPTTSAGPVVMQSFI